MRLYVTPTGEVEAEDLRLAALTELTRLHGESVYLTTDRYAGFWEKLHAEIVSSEDDEKQEYFDIETQLKTLPMFIETWIKTAVESRERWELFVMIKAQEIQSGDKERDYYWALHIRHDQIVGLVRVLTKLVDLLSGWVTEKPAVVMEEPVFWGLSTYPVEKQIYLEAEKVHHEREH